MAGREDGKNKNKKKENLDRKSFKDVRSTEIPHFRPAVLRFLFP